ncbi:hypothetical protein [Bacillus sp. 1NLA3E]|uniref:hypothetical protein n=1 Tax=Bacillus sp. 1NLA3E TaxID=666686 RepID=UPI000247EE1D|nr:hypothetical protein [Bacillus sp. 1NLA3E]
MNKKNNIISLKEYEKKKNKERNEMKVVYISFSLAIIFAASLSLFEPPYDDLDIIIKNEHHAVL